MKSSKLGISRNNHGKNDDSTNIKNDNFQKKQHVWGHPLNEEAVMSSQKSLIGGAWPWDFFSVPSP